MHYGTKKLLIPLLLLLAMTPSGDGFKSGLRAYRQGRYQEALAAFRAAEEAAGTEVSAELLYNQALAALRTGDLLRAETAAEKAAARGGPEFTGLRNFMLGNAAFARCLLAEKQATLPGAPPFAIDAAIALAYRALAAWRHAAMHRPNWLVAGRNIERALLKAASLQEKKEKAARERAKLRALKARPHLVPRKGPGKEGKKEEKEQAPQAQKDSRVFTTAQINSLFKYLDRKEGEKRKLRRAKRRLRQGKVERDW